MKQKRLTVLLYGSDRNLWRGGRLTLRVTDLFASGGPRVVYNGDTEESTLDFSLDLPFDAGQAYGLTFDARDHRPAWQIIRRQDFIRGADKTERDDLLLRLMLVPDDPGTSDLDAGWDRLKKESSPFVREGSGIDEAAFKELKPPAKMAFFNVEAKLRETMVAGASLLSFVRAITHVAVDRIFLQFDAALKPHMLRHPDFASAPGHGAPKTVPGLPAHPDSWKHTKYAEGNVQLSFSEAASPLNGDGSPLAHSADVDIDLGRGLAHAHEWLVNNVFLPGHKTNQALVYGLLWSQNILPRYVLDPLPATTSRALMRLAKGPGKAPAKARAAAPKRRAAVTKRRAARKAAPKTSAKPRPRKAAARRR